jgi:hypothetical protein
MLKAVIFGKRFIRYSRADVERLEREMNLRREAAHA